MNNILIIIADQLTWRALPAYGNTYARMPAVDSVSRGAARFDACYTPCPLCLPARAALWSGLYPHQTGALSNGRKFPIKTLGEGVPTLGGVFSAAGYEARHFGKKHDAGALRGFVCEEEKALEVEAVSDAWPVGQDTGRDRYTTTKCVEYLENRPRTGRPFIAVADLVNPHDICSWIGHNQGVHTDKPIGRELPPLPENFQFDDIANRPLPVKYICCSHNRQAQTAGWTPENFRHYLAAYHHYAERVDAEIGLILDALKRGGAYDDTLIVFMADHGDSMAARGRVTKQVDLYEEVTRVPFLFKGPGVTPGAHAAPVSLLDLFPTLCAYAGIPAPDGLMGRDLGIALAGGDAPTRPYVASEWHTEWGFTISPGRMLRAGRHKYIAYVEGGGEELYDLEADPYEKVNRAGDPAYAKPLAEMRGLFERFLGETGDDFRALSYLADKRWRSHPVGYQNHEGIAAPMTESTASPKE